MNHIPASMQVTLFIESLLPPLQDAVILKEPKTLEQ